jgi:hypothetical protein
MAGKIESWLTSRIRLSHWAKRWRATVGLEELEPVRKAELVTR